ncbi:MFS transporter [Actinoplanes sp. TFC3]|uniref:MFS transporter n=1 Tax=Actinoplanes sp. TFC3 TaxID=1710355 RepID=UPI0009E6CDDA|nr:MFS transporter [Actinoplanes sp. TFC3]
MTVALVAGFMTLLDVSIVNVAIPSIQADLKLSSGELQWVLSGYALTFGLMLVPSGRFGDARGRRTVFLAGLAVFVLSSAAAGFATGPLFLVVARLVQGAAAGVVSPQVSGLIQQLFKPEERGRPFGLFGATVGISTAVGPLLGGLLIQLLGAEQGWRWIFFINVPIGIAALILGRMWIPGPASSRSSESDSRSASRSDDARESLDPVGVVLLGAGVLLFLLPLVQEREWHTPLKWLLSVAAVAVLAAFLVWERRFEARGHVPVVELKLFKLRSYGLGALTGMLYFAGFTTIFFIYTLYLQSGLHYSALAAGLSLTPFALGSAASAAVGGRIVNRFGRQLVVAGLVLVLAGLAATLVALHFVPGHNAGWAAAGPLLVAGIGSGLVISPNQNLTLSEVPVRRAGSAGAVLQTGQRIGTAVGIAVVGSVFFNRLAANGGSWSLAFRTALFLTIAFVVVALIAAVGDVVAGRRDSSSGSPSASSRGSSSGAASSPGTVSSSVGAESRA